MIKHYVKRDPVTSEVQEEDSKEPVTKILQRNNPIEVEWLVNQFELYANLSKGRNFFWRIFFEDTLKPEFLSSAIWDSNY